MESTSIFSGSFHQVANFFLTWKQLMTNINMMDKSIRGWVFFDEITSFEEEQYLYLHARCRSTNPKLIPRVRCTGTPVGKC
ncbi:MAG: hypothetical protein CM15mV101_300 [uncultured marine virus]|nr:MAG: hypothetical protein CM15mV101_300 [uncultured marine virus]